MSQETELYRLINTDEEAPYVCEFGWEEDKFFLVWVSYFYLEDFIDRLIQIFGNGVFDGNVFSVNFKEDGVCIDLSEVLDEYVEIEKVFPKDKFRH